MNCKHVLKLMDDYCSGDTDKVVRKMIERHLKTCAECRKAFESEMIVSNFLKKADVSESEISVANDLLKKLDDLDREIHIEPKTMQPRLLNPWLKAFMIGLLMAGVALIGILVTRFEPRSDYHTVGDFSGPAYTWMGTPPVDDGMETRWQDPVLIGRDHIMQKESKEAVDNDEDNGMGRVEHILDFDKFNNDHSEGR